MISYEVIYSEGNGRPYLNKVYNIPNSEPIKISMNMAMPQEDIDSIPTETIFSYLDSLVSYIQESSSSLNTIGLDETKGEYFWSMWGWAEINWAHQEHTQWWRYAYYSRESGE